MAGGIPSESQLYVCDVLHVIDLAIGWAETYRLIGKSSVAGADHVA